MKRLTTLAISSTKNIDVTLTEGDALIVQLTGNSSFDGTVDLQSTSDGPNYVNHPYESLHVASPSRSVAQLTSISTRTSYLIVPPARQCRIKITYVGTGNLDVVYQEVSLPFDPASGGGGTVNAFLAAVGGALDDAAAAGAVTTDDTAMQYIKQIVTAILVSAALESATAVGRKQVKTTTIDLHQAAASYDLLTGTAQDFMLEGFSFKLPNLPVDTDCNITGITIQTDDETPGVLIDASAGTLANLTVEGEITWYGRMKITVGTKIRLTIVGGTADIDPTTCLITADGFAIVAGGNLA